LNDMLVCVLYVKQTKKKNIQGEVKEIHLKLGTRLRANESNAGFIK
jgi:hypothetical protein